MSVPNQYRTSETKRRPEIRERVKIEKTAQSKTVHRAKETRGYLPGKDEVKRQLYYMGGKMKKNFNYFYGEQADQFLFYRTPKAFFTDKEFEDLSAEAKILYGLLLDRVSLSTMNGWKDDKGRIYVYCTLESIQEALGCAHQKATKLLTELSRYGLIERKKQGLGKPAIIYVKNFTDCQNSALQTAENHLSGQLKNSATDCTESAGNNTNLNKTYSSNTYPIISTDVDMDEIDTYRHYFEEQLCLEALYNDFPYDRENISEIFELIVDTVSSKRKTIRIAGDDKPADVVKSRFMKLDYSHISYVMDCMKKNDTEIKNIKQYILAALYNASMTISSFYQAMYNNDHAKGLV